MPFNNKTFRFYRCPDPLPVPQGGTVPHPPSVAPALLTSPLRKCRPHAEGRFFLTIDPGGPPCPWPPCKPAKPWKKGQKMSDGEKAEAGGMEGLYPGSTWPETKPHQSPSPGARPRRTAQPAEGSAAAFHFKPALGFLLAEAQRLCVYMHTTPTHASRQLTANSEACLSDPEQNIFRILF